MDKVTVEHSKEEQLIIYLKKERAKKNAPSQLERNGGCRTLKSPVL